jgi:hypothetical protein
VLAVRPPALAGVVADRRARNCSLNSVTLPKCTNRSPSSQEDAVIANSTRPKPEQPAQPGPPAVTLSHRNPKFLAQPETPLRASHRQRGQLGTLLNRQKQHLNPDLHGLAGR